jgi:hypothetical protein
VNFSAGYIIFLHPEAPRLLTLEPDSVKMLAEAWQKSSWLGLCPRMEAQTSRAAESRFPLPPIIPIPNRPQGSGYKGLAGQAVSRFF